MVSPKQFKDVSDPLTARDWPSMEALTSHPVVVNVNRCQSVSSIIVVTETATLEYINFNIELIHVKTNVHVYRENKGL